ncbi:MAG TPA: MarR family transcriptional regulator [Acidimicrobiales bacterium]|nr:MarR family transcriptional regulator [Acidimicrobiales bacterium]
MGGDFEDEFPGADPLATECYANLVRTGDLLIGLHNRQAWEEYRLSATAKMALAVIEGAGEPLEPSVIAERLLITSGSMTSMLDTLERRGLVRRMPHPDDRRKLLVEVTDEAAAILDALLPSLHQREKAVIGRALSPEEGRRLLELLAKVQEAAAASAGDPADHTARRRRPARLSRPG